MKGSQYPCSIRGHFCGFLWHTYQQIEKITHHLEKCGGHNPAVSLGSDFVCMTFKSLACHQHHCTGNKSDGRSIGFTI